VRHGAGGLWRCTAWEATAHAARGAELRRELVNTAKCRDFLFEPLDGVWTLDAGTKVMS
jgi:hypothetical protein